MLDRAVLSPRAVNLAALVWGFAEATLFFVVPDVLLSWIALGREAGQDPVRSRGGTACAAWVACAWAVVGALIGGAVMYGWGAADAETALQVLDYVPAVSRGMCSSVSEQIHDQGVGALFFGPITGTPYKVFAVQAGAQRLDLALFLLVSVPGRLARFALITGLTMLVCRLLPRMTLFVRRLVHAGFWTAFYVWYFCRMGL